MINLNKIDSTRKFRATMPLSRPATLWFLLTLVTLSLVSTKSLSNSDIQLTPEEQQLLQKIGHVDMCVDPNWMPYERINEDGRHEGISADYMRLVASKLGVKLKLHPTQSWQESLDAVRSRKCDILSLARETEERKRYLNFTRPYTQYPYVIVTTNEKFFIDDLQRESRNLFAVTRGYAVGDFVRQTFPNMQLIEVDNIYDGLKRVRRGEVFGYIDSVLSIGYAIQISGALDLKISGTLGYKATPSLAVRNDMPLLHSAFQKGLDAISDYEKQTIYNHWVSVQMRQRFDYTPVWQGALVMLAFTAGILLWNRRLHSAHKVAQNALHELHQAQAKLQDKNRQLERLASTDILTGLHNRLKVDETLEQEIHRFNRYNTPFSVIMLDIDKFKVINDTFGHQTGDGVLSELAALLLKFSRTTDTVGRWGGEEFLIVCPGTTLQGASKLANTLREAIEAHPFPTVSSVTGSLGVATTQAGESSKDLISRVDKALYNAKNNGRNRVEII